MPSRQRPIHLGERLLKGLRSVRGECKVASFVKQDEGQGVDEETVGVLVIGT